MTLLTDDETENAAQSTFSPVQQQRLERLNQFADLRALTAAELVELDELVNLYDLAVLRRAKALASLAYQGKVISTTWKQL